MSIGVAFVRHRWLAMEQWVSRHVVLLAVMSLAVLVAGVLLVRWQAAPAAADGAAKSVAGGAVTLAPGADRAAGVAVQAARLITSDDTLDAPAVLALDETATARLGSMFEATVVRVFSDVGDRVGAGDVVAELHGQIVHDARADYRKAVADARRLGTELSYLREAELRAERLFEAKAISALELQRARANHTATREEVDAARAEVRRAEDALGHLGMTTHAETGGEIGDQIPVRAPVAGVILERLVTPGTAVTPGTPLFVVSDLSRLWALAEIDETSLHRVRRGGAVQVRVSAYPDRTFAGTIAFIGDTVNSRTRRVMVRCVVPNPDSLLKPEMYAIVGFRGREPRPVVAVPANAVQEIDGKPLVFVSDARGRFERRAVVTGPERGGWIEIHAGLRAGERVAAAGSFLLKSELLEAGEDTP